MTDNIEMSVVIPVFNEEKNISYLYAELVKTLREFNFNSEVIFADDGSRDDTFARIKELAALPTIRIKAVSFSRNFGHQAALSAGLENATGRVIISMDGDMQHPPSVIPELYNKYLEGYDIVNTIRISDDKVGFMKRFSSESFYSIFNLLSDVKIESATADFRLLNRKSLDAFLQLSEKDRFIRGLVVWMGFKQTHIKYKANLRLKGDSKFTPLKMLTLSLNALTSFSTKPLRLPLVTGVVVLIMAAIYSLFAIYNYFKGNNLPGWTSLLISVLFIGSVQLISLGILGEYLGRVFNESKNRPLYLVKETWKSE